MGIDIQFTYEPYGKRGKGGKINYLQFTIKENKNYIDQLTLEMFINNKKHDSEEEEKQELQGKSPYDEKIEFLTEACNNEFSEKEISVLYDIMVANLPQTLISNELECYNHIIRKYREMEMRNERNKIEHRFAYMKTIIATE